MSFDAQINFRATLAYVTDGAGQTFAGNEVYPTTRNGLTFGVGSTTDQTRNRTTSGDVRLAGVFFRANTTVRQTFRLDGLSPGEASVRLAIGDSTVQGYHLVEVLDSDGSTLLFAVEITSGTAANEYADAQGVVYSRADWPGSNSPRSVTLSGTSVFLRIGAVTTQAGSTSLAHFAISQSPSASIPAIYYAVNRRR